jgi:hypothetical protein
MRRVFELNFISFFLHQNSDEEMFFEEQKIIIGFCFNHLVDEVVHKMSGVEGQGLC